MAISSFFGYVHHPGQKRYRQVPLFFCGGGCRRPQLTFPAAYLFGNAGSALHFIRGVVALMLSGIRLFLLIPAALPTPPLPLPEWEGFHCPFFLSGHGYAVAGKTTPATIFPWANDDPCLPRGK